jgi:hypothetical protein
VEGGWKGEVVNRASEKGWLLVQAFEAFLELRRPKSPPLNGLD